MDAPAGVGFSIRTGNSSLFVYTDDEVANDNYLAVKAWFKASRLKNVVKRLFRSSRKESTRHST